MASAMSARVPLFRLGLTPDLNPHSPQTQTSTSRHSPISIDEYAP
jgi:hypothetical protein